MFISFQVYVYFTVKLNLSTRKLFFCLCSHNIYKHLNTCFCLFFRVQKKIPLPVKCGWRLFQHLFQPINQLSATRCADVGFFENPFRIQENTLLFSLVFKHDVCKRNRLTQSQQQRSLIKLLRAVP